MKPHWIDNIMLVLYLNVVLFFLLSLAWGGMAWPAGGIADDGSYVVGGMYDENRTVSYNIYRVSRIWGMVTAATVPLGVVLLAAKRLLKMPADG